ncbi:MAG: hypothetical protein K2X81_03555, partial [Candidatus Obscuribacterales bacterium]|nr:hypothetical protein [Candidatus Obscuribacterales bacterium]
RRITAPNKDSTVGATELPKPTVDSPDFRNSHGPASIRNNNPGAMYPGESARKFGSTVTHTIGGGHKIAEFPDAISGAAAQFDLLNSDSYRNKSVASAIAKWCGHSNPGAYNRFLKEHGIDTKATIGDVMADKDKAITLASTMARVEAGKDFPLNKEQWGAAFDKYKEHATEHAPPATKNHDVSHHRSDSSHHHNRGHHHHTQSHHHHHRRRHH